MSRFMKNSLADLIPYTPGEQPSKKMIKLNTNENPYPPSPAVEKILENMDEDKGRLYSDPQASAAKKAIAGYYGIRPDQTIMFNGSDEGLAMSFMAFGENICFPEISYSFYKVFARVFSRKYSMIPLKKDFTIDPDDYIRSTGTVLIANPNAPTGIALDPDQIERIVASDKDRMVIVDEAYIDFGGETCTGLIDKYDNLLVIQTMSKSRSLAGLRIGYAMSSSDIIKDLDRIRYSFNPYNMNALSIAAAEAAMNDREYFRETSEKIMKTREMTVSELRKLGLDILPSKANFIFVKGGPDYYEKLKEKNILARYWNESPLSDWVRISIGTWEEMKELVKATKEIQCEKAR